ncbi:MAG: insulinase family protein [Labilithrix sp.]|nr:insulinase family protein [Labilithrix sp.]MCW5814504.1 insulinase family protein [Labilithrix sp.]
MKRLVLSISSLLLVTACGAPKVASTGPAKVEIPAYDGMPPPKKKAAPARQSPPPSGATKESPFPKVARSKLANGLGLDVVTAKTLPLVNMRVVVKAGSAYGAAPGLGDLTAEMLKNGGTRALASAELLRRVETLGSNLSIATKADSTTIALVVTKDKVAEGLSLLSQVVREPRFDDGELKKYKTRLVDQTEDQLRSNGRFTAGWIAWNELYGPTHPYAMRDALPAQIAKLGRAEVVAHHKKFFVPSNATLILAGDVDEAQAKDLAQKSFGAWTGGAAPKIDFAEPKAPDKTRVIVAHRPKSAQSDVFVVLLAPERQTKEWPRLRVATHVLGGGVASRLFGDVREQRSLAYAVSASISELAHGKQPLMLYAGTQSAKTTEAVSGLLENLDRMATSPPSAQETETARRYLSDSFAIYMETVGAIASLVGTQESLGLPDSYWDDYRREVRKTEAGDAAAASQLLFGGANERALIVVSGDADAIGQDLTRFGEVTVVDPEKEFKPIKKLEAKK